MYADKLSSILGRTVTIAPLPLTLRYPPAVLRREGLKGVLGVAVCWGTVIGLNPAPVIAWPLGVFGGLFLLYAGQQWRRRALRIALDGQGVSAGAGRRKVIAWAALEELRLKFCPHGRRALHGTLVLSLRAGRARIRLDSSLEHFPTLLLHAASAARERGLEADPTTRGNLKQIGL